MKKSYVFLIVMAFIFGDCQSLFATNSKESTRVNQDTAEPTLELGAKIYVQRCVLCHGLEGKGDGVIPRKITHYPSTDLFKAKFPTDRENLKEMIIYGGSKGALSNYMPPMGNDLTWTELESVADFVVLIREKNSQAMAMIEQVKKDKPSSRRLGQEIFKSRCALCHGKYGEGDGRMAKVITSPPPYDLTASRMPDDYLMKIISEGGEFMKRSPQMPPWKNELRESEIESVIIYIKSIRD